LDVKAAIDPTKRLPPFSSTVNPNTGMPFQTFDVFIRYRCSGIGNLVFMKPSLPREQQLAGGAYVYTTAATQLQASNQGKITIGFKGVKIL